MVKNNINITNKDCSVIRQAADFRNFMNAMKNKGYGFENSELSTNSILKFLFKQRFIHVFKKYENLICENGDFTSDIYANKFKSLIDTIYDFEDVYIANMMLYFELLSSNLLEDSKTNYYSKELLSEYSYELECFRDEHFYLGSYISNHISVNPFEFYIGLHPNCKFKINCIALESSDGMMRVFDIFGQNLVPRVLLSDLLENPNKVNEPLSHSRPYNYSPYDVDIVDLSKNTLSKDSVHLISSDNENSYGTDYLGAGYTCIYSDSISNFLNKASEAEVNELLSCIDDFFKYKSIEIVTRTKPFIVKKGDAMYEKLKYGVRDEGVEIFITVGEFYWDYCEWYSFSSPTNLQHTKLYFDKINNILEGY